MYLVYLNSNQNAWGVLTTLRFEDVLCRNFTLLLSIWDPDHSQAYRYEYIYLIGILTFLIS